MMVNNTQSVRFAFFGSSRMSTVALDELKKAGLMPAIIVTTPDKPQGRKLILSPNTVKVWGNEQSISVIDSLEKVSDLVADVFIVASYGKILPSSVFNRATQGTLNIHPSLLPKYRGPSPLQQAMLDDAKHTGVTIMKIDEQMDHGPIVAQKSITVNEWPTYEDFEEMMAREGARLLAESLPSWIDGSIRAKEQDHAAATYTKKFTKEDGLISLADLKSHPYDSFRKIQAFHEWPQAYILIEHAGKKIRVKITSASYKNSKLILEKVVPEGSREMSYRDFTKGYGI